MSDRDEELDRILEVFSEVQPNSAQIRRWQSLGYVKSTNRNWIERSVSLAVAASIGFLVGAFLIKNRSENQVVANNFDSTATIESDYIKSP